MLLEDNVASYNVPTSCRRFLLRNLSATSKTWNDLVIRPIDTKTDDTALCAMVTSRPARLCHNQSRSTGMNRVSSCFIGHTRCSVDNVWNPGLLSSRFFSVIYANWIETYCRFVYRVEILSCHRNKMTTTSLSKKKKKETCLKNNF